MADKTTITYRTYPHPHDPTVKVVDVLGPDGKADRTFNRRWGDAQERWRGWCEGEWRGETTIRRFAS